MSRLYPAFLRLEDRDVLVVGGGSVASAKLPGLLDAGARVRVVAPEIGAAFERPDVVRHRRPFRDADLDGVAFAIAAAPADVNRAVARAAGTRGVFVNAVDDPANGSAFLGGVVRKGGVTLAISTDGAAPALAGLLREALDAVLPDDLEAWVSVARARRAAWKADGVPLARRRPLLLEALNDLHAARPA